MTPLVAESGALPAPPLAHVSALEEICSVAGRPLTPATASSGTSDAGGPFPF